MFLLRIFAAKNSQKRSEDLASPRNTAGSPALKLASSTGAEKGICASTVPDIRDAHF